MRIVIQKVLPLVIATSLGCIAQYGDPGDPTSSSSAAVDEAREQPGQPSAEQRAQTQALEHQQVRNTPLLDKGARTGATSKGDPSQDDDGEPVPQPWQPHTSTTTTTHQR